MKFRFHLGRANQVYEMLSISYNIFMSHRSRRALFYAFCALFLILGTGIVLYAQGWRMDFPSFRVSKVGGIYVRSYPENAAIFLNGKPLSNQSGFLSRGTLISDLFPKTYRLALTAPGYIDWHENMTVTPSLVENHKYAVLVPANATSAATGTIASFATTRANLILEKTNGEIARNSEIIGFGKMIVNAADAQAIIFQTAKGTYEFMDLATDVATNLSNMMSRAGFGATSPLEISFDPSVNTTVIAADGAKVDLLDMAQFTNTIIGKAPKGEVIAPSIAVSPNTVAWAESASHANSSTLFFYDLSLKITASTTVALEAPVKKLAWISGGLLGILTENGAFYLYDTNQQNLRKIADDVRSSSATADGSRIATLESNSLEIFTLNDPEKYYRFNLPDVGDAETALWYHDSDHLFIAYSDHVSFLDLEDASLANFTTVAQGTSAQYDPDANALYVIDPADQLLRFDFPK